MELATFGYLSGILNKIFAVMSLVYFLLLIFKRNRIKSLIRMVLMMVFAILTGILEEKIGTSLVQSGISMNITSNQNTEYISESESHFKEIDTIFFNEDVKAINEEEMTYFFQEFSNYNQKYKNTKKPPKEQRLFELMQHIQLDAKDYYESAINGDVHYLREAYKLYLTHRKELGALYGFEYDKSKKANISSERFNFDDNNGVSDTNNYSNNHDKKASSTDLIKQIQNIDGNEVQMLDTYENIVSLLGTPHDANGEGGVTYLTYNGINLTLQGIEKESGEFESLLTEIGRNDVFSSKEEVISMLGQPDDEQFIQEFNETKMVYQIDDGLELSVMVSEGEEVSNVKLTQIVN